MLTIILISILLFVGLSFYYADFSSSGGFRIKTKKRYLVFLLVPFSMWVADSIEFYNAMRD